MLGIIDHRKPFRTTLEITELGQQFSSRDDRKQSLVVPQEIKDDNQDLCFIDYRSRVSCMVRDYRWIDVGFQQMMYL